MNADRLARGKDVLVLEPTHLIGLGLIIVLVGVGWQALQPSDPRALAEKLNKLEYDFDKLVRPRTISEEQISTIEKFLLERADQRKKAVIHYPPSNEEASEYAAGIYHGFRRGGWEASIKPLDHGQSVNDGLSFQVYAPPMDEEATRPTTQELVMRALAAAKITYNGSGGGVRQDVEETTVFFYVGHRPRR